MCNTRYRSPLLHNAYAGMIRRTSVLLDDSGTVISNVGDHQGSSGKRLHAGPRLESPASVTDDDCPPVFNAGILHLKREASIVLPSSPAGTQYGREGQASPTVFLLRTWTSIAHPLILVRHHVVVSERGPHTSTSQCLHNKPVALQPPS